MEEPTVLVVDDEEDFVQTLLKRLRRIGVDCDGAYNGIEALDKVSERDFDVVLLDMKLVKEDGNDVLREIKLLRPETEVVILTGHASASAGREGLEHGAFDYLIKPVEFETLHEKLREAGRSRFDTADGRAPEKCKPNS